MARGLASTPGPTVFSSIQDNQEHIQWLPKT
jgi:hypothetical protein